jgi:hypothetical protein
MSAGEVLQKLMTASVEDVLFTVQVVILMILLLVLLAQLDFN